MCCRQLLEAAASLATLAQRGRGVPEVAMIERNGDPIARLGPLPSPPATSVREALTA